MIYFQSQVDRLLKSKDEQIAVFMTELARATADAVRERARAEQAIDQVLALSGGRPVTPAEPRKKNGVDVNAGLGEIFRAGQEYGEEPKPE